MQFRYLFTKAVSQNLYFSPFWQNSARPNPSDPPKTPTTSLVAGVLHFAPAVKEVRSGGKHAHVLSLKLHREDLLTSVSVPTDETHDFLSW